MIASHEIILHNLLSIYLLCHIRKKNTLYKIELHQNEYNQINYARVEFLLFELEFDKLIT